MKDMTQQEAKAEAFRRWGPAGKIEFHPPRVARAQRGRLARYACTVGNGAAGSRRTVEGQGDTWLEAFADAQSR